VRPVLLIVAPAALALAAPAWAGTPATTGIVPQQGIRGVAVGMDLDQVKAALGRPRAARWDATELVPRQLTLTYPGLQVRLSPGADRPEVISVTTTSRADRTVTGVGVGSGERGVRAGLRGVRCRTEFGARHCWVGAFLPGRRITDMPLLRGRVVSVTIGIVID
jgi:hypothetical protein